MNKIIRINNNIYDLKVLSKKCNYFLAMYNFEQKKEIDLTHRGKSYEIVIKILLNQYVYDNDYIIYYDEIINLKDELMLDNNIYIKSIEEMCECIMLAICEMKKINRAISRFQSNKLTKKQRKSEENSRLYWKKIKYLNFSLSIDENKNIYDENNSLKKDRYEGILNFDIISNAYLYSNLLKISNYLIFKENTNAGRRYGISFFDSDKLLLIDNYFELYLENINLNNRSYNIYPKKDEKTFTDWINSNKIEKLCLTDCYFYLEKNENDNLQNLIENYIILKIPNLKHLEIKNLKINKNDYRLFKNEEKEIHIINNLLFSKNIIIQFDNKYEINYIGESYDD